MLRLATTLALAVTLAPAALTAQQLVAAELSGDSVSLLEGRLNMNVLAGGELEARGHSIMAAAPQNAVESRVRIDAGDERMVIMAYELFATCGDSFATTTASFLEPLGDDALVRAPVQANDTEYVLYTPTERDLTTEAVHVGTGFVCAADRHVVRIDFLVNPAGAEDMPGLEGRVGDMLNSVSSGDRVIAAGERTVSLGEGLELPLSSGIYHYSQMGPDFIVNYLGQVSVLGEPAGTVLLYIGGHPTRRHSNEPNVLSTLFESEVLWSIEERNGRESLEALVPHPNGEFTILHILVSAEDRVVANDLRTMVEGMQPRP